MKKPLLVFFLVALAVAAFLSPFASSNPDGLDRAAQDLGFEERSEGKEPFEALIPDYKFPGIGNESAATSLAGILGALLTFGVAYGVGKAVAKRNKTMV